MSVKPINPHYSFENPGTIYDEEAMTGLKLAGRTAAKVNETVNAFNELEHDTNEHLENQDKTIDTRLDSQDKAIVKMSTETMPAQVHTYIKGYIANGTFDNAIEEHIGNLEDRVDNLLGSVTEGSTTMDAEVIDARTDIKGKAHKNLGEAIRSQILNSVAQHSITETGPNENGNYDADNALEPGYYIFVNSNNVDNIPDGIVNGCILTMASTTSPAYRTYQLLLPYASDFIYHRYMSNGKFVAWRRIVDKAEVENLIETHLDTTLGDTVNIVDKQTLRQIKVVVGENTDANQLNRYGIYWVSSQHSWSNLPTGETSGCLLMFQGNNVYNKYQLFMAYDTHTLYFRHMLTNQTWTAWVDFSATGGAVSGGSNYLIENHNNQVYIYRRTANGYIKYVYGRHIDEGLRLDVNRLISIEVCDKDLKTVKTISTIGADQEGVVLISGYDDYVGGCHGYEQGVSNTIIVNGKVSTLSDVENGECDEIKIIVNSELHDRDGDALFHKTKAVTFDANGVHIQSVWTCDQDEVALTHFRTGFSINKEAFTHYSTGNYLNPIEESSEGVIDSGMEEVNEVSFVGGVSAKHHYNSTHEEWMLMDFGTRCKSYFDSHIGETLYNDDAPITIEHSFNILY